MMNTSFPAAARTVRQLAASLLAAAALWAAQAQAAQAYEQCDGLHRVTDVVGDAEVRQRIVDAAAGEWRRFGFQVLDLTTPEWTADLSPLIGFNPPLGELPGELLGVGKGRLMRIGVAENEYDGMTLVRSYWGAVTMRDTGRISVGGVAWSSAFVSWVMCRAGLSDAQFNRRDSHALYVAAAFRAEAANGVAASNGYAYVARPMSTPVKPGDLACFSSSPMSFDERRRASLAADWTSRGGSSHCDIIVGFAGDGARVLAIGGNVEQSVTMSVFAARREGANVYLLGRDQWPSARPFFAVMQLRARPDLADRVVMSYARPAC
ncbi:MAG: DUF2272 domain-containing protein [Vitreimonas sp.]